MAEYLPPQLLPEEYLDISVDACEKGRLLTLTAHGPRAKPCCVRRAAKAGRGKPEQPLAALGAARVSATDTDGCRTCTRPFGTLADIWMTDMKILVQKFGGTSVANLECMRQVQTKVLEGLAQGYKVIAVLSARAGDTNKAALPGRGMVAYAGQGGL